MQQLLTVTIKPKNQRIFIQELIRLIMDSGTSLHVTYNIQDADNVDFLEDIENEFF